MNQGYKPTDPVPNKEARTKVLWAFQDSETVIRSSILSGDTETLKNS